MFDTPVETKSEEYVETILSENPELESIVKEAKDFDSFTQKLREWLINLISKDQDAISILNYSHVSNSKLHNLRWNDFAAVRLIDYIDNEGRDIADLNFFNTVIKNSTMEFLFNALKNNTIEAEPDFYEDLIYLFRQLNGKLKRDIPDIRKIQSWMDKHPSGLDKKVLEHRQSRKEHIIKILIDKIEKGEMKSSKFKFPTEASNDEKFQLMNEWWDNHTFHLQFAVRSSKLLKDFLKDVIDPEHMKLMCEGETMGIPIFVNPYYLSLMISKDEVELNGSDLPLRQYMFYSSELINKFGKIVAWEKEDVVEPGKPNAAGWILPPLDNIHRRYPEVAILIPDTGGKTCAGLCSSCQRMYHFQSGNLNFNLENLSPKERWPQKLKRLLDYFRYDSKLRDILITGGDALMSTDKSLQDILDGIYDMALMKIEDNRSRPDDKKYAEILRVRLGTRIPVYLPQRVTPKLVEILKNFKEKSEKIGIKQFVIQSHFESAMEITKETQKAIRLLTSAGWTVTNQNVFTSAVSRRGHTAKLRKVLNDIGVLTYYTFTVKGYKENYHNFATNSRSVQEMVEEKYIGEVPKELDSTIQTFPLNSEKNIENIALLRDKLGIPFLATDRNLINLPGKGKSMTFRTIGVTKDGRRILEFSYDHTRTHSPIIDHDSKLIIVESKTIRKYLDQMTSMGENEKDYESIWGYSISHTERRKSVFEYPKYSFAETDDYTNIKIK